MSEVEIEADVTDQETDDQQEIDQVAMSSDKDISFEPTENMSNLEQQINEVLVLNQVLNEEIQPKLELEGVIMKEEPIEPQKEESSMQTTNEENTVGMKEVTTVKSEEIPTFDELMDIEDDAPFVRRSRRLQSIHLETFPIKTEESASMSLSTTILTEKRVQLTPTTGSGRVQESENDKENIQSAVSDSVQEETAKPIQEVRTKVEHTDIRLKRYETIRDNIYSKKSDKKVCKVNKTMKCDCTITEEEVKNGELGCLYNCINRILYIECGLKCRCGGK